MRRAAAQSKESAPDTKLRKRGKRIAPVQDQGLKSTAGGLSLSLSPTLLAQPKGETQPKNTGRTGRKVAASTPVREPVSRKAKATQQAQAKPDRKKVAAAIPVAAKVETPVTRPAPQMVASGRKRALRGRKRIILPEIEGWGIYNREASHLVRGFFSRKTDAISHLEDTIQEPWSKIKHEGKFAPVRLTIKINEDDLASATVQ